MKKSKTKLYLLLIGAGGVALSVDRCFLSRPSATPEQAVAALKPAVRTSPANAEKSVPAIPALPFPRSVVPLDPQQKMRDVFVNPERQTAPTGAAAAAGLSAHPTPGPMSFGDTHRLEAIFVDQGLAFGVVNGNIVREGEMISGCELVKLDGTKAHFACGRVSVVLELADVDPAIHR